MKSLEYYLICFQKQQYVLRTVDSTMRNYRISVWRVGSCHAKKAVHESIGQPTLPIHWDCSLSPPLSIINPVVLSLSYLSIWCTVICVGTPPPFLAPLLLLWMSSMFLSTVISPYSNRSWTRMPSSRISEGILTPINVTGAPLRWSGLEMPQIPTAFNSFVDFNSSTSVLDSVASIAQDHFFLRSSQSRLSYYSGMDRAETRNLAQMWLLVSLTSLLATVLYS